MPSPRVSASLSSLLRFGFARAVNVLLASAAFLAVQAKVGDWKSYTSFHAITSLADYRGTLVAGTEGGVRFIDPKTLSEKAYDNLDGLLDVWITGLVATDDGTLWAIGHDGFVHSFDGNRFTAYGQSYVTERWTMNPRAVVAGGAYLALGSSKGLTFFDTRTKAAVASLNRFGAAIGDSVLALLRRGDTLYISTGKAVYQAAVDWQNLLAVQKYGSIYDPRIWKKVDFSGDTARRVDDTLPFVREYGSLAWENGRIESYATGTVLNTPKRVVALAERPVVIGKVSYELATNFSVAGAIGHDVFVANDFGLFRARQIENNDSVAFIYVFPVRDYPRDRLFNITAHSGSVYAHGYRSKYHLENERFVENRFGYLPSEELQTRTLRNLVSGKNGEAYVGAWGQGLMRMRGLDSASLKGDESCPASFPGLPGFQVTHAISHPYGDHLWMGMFLTEVEDYHQIVHYDIANEEFTCLETRGMGRAPHMLETLDDSLLAVGSDIGLYLYRYETRPTSIRLVSEVKADGDVNDTWGVRRDAFDRIWFLQGGKLNYVDSLSRNLNAKVSPKPFEAFTGSECHVLASDPARGLWAGCKNGLFRIVPAASLRDVRITRFSVYDGLLSNTVYDVSVDPVTGLVWAVTDRGISRYEGGIALPKTSLDGLNVYPNPLRKTHRFMVFDQLPPKSELRIHTQAGEAVRTFRPGDLKGFQAQWDGTNDAGKAVAPGVYLYTVKAGSQTKRGRVIVAR